MKKLSVEDQAQCSPQALTQQEFATISALARSQVGVELGPGKEQLVDSRVGKLMRQLGFSTFRAFYQHLRCDQTGEALAQLIDALTTNHTGFFREQAHFDFLAQRIFPEWRSPHPMRIWSAACSTGEEPYTIAMVAREYFGAQSTRLPHIFASDISRRALKAACRGIYPAERVQPLEPPALKKHFMRGQGRWEGSYRVRPEILSMLEFHRINLIEPLSHVGRFAVIFCRNVMIYFSRQTQERLVYRLAACLEPDGYLIIGQSESLTGIQHRLQHIQPAVYRNRGGKR